MLKGTGAVKGDVKGDGTNFPRPHPFPKKGDGTNIHDARHTSARPPQKGDGTNIARVRSRVVC
jgi:hypothetical protein